MEEKKIENVSVNEKKGRCVYAAPVARALVKRDFKVIDLKPNKENRDKTVVVFEENSAFNAALEEILNEFAEKKARRLENKRLNELERATFL